MIQEDILRSIRHGVCAIGWLSVTAEEQAKAPMRPFFQIIGTGFLVRETIAITNRHVVEALIHAQSKFGFPDNQRFVSFVHSRPGGGWQMNDCRIQFAGVIPDPELDVAFIEFKRRPEPAFEQCRTLLLIEDYSAIQVGQPLGIVGYPYGTSLLVNPRVDPHRIWRFGPILQQGYVSALSPYESKKPITDILMDVRTTGGMSGSPVFSLDSGSVFGLHYSGWEATTANAIPLDTPRVTQWLNDLPW